MAASAHLRSQLDGPAVDDERAITVMVDGLGLLLRRIDPRFEHLENEEIVLVHQTAIGHFAIQIGKAFSDQGCRDALGWHRGQGERPELRNIAAGSGLFWNKAGNSGWRSDTLDAALRSGKIGTLEAECFTHLAN